MNGFERTVAFLERKPVDRPPFHPIIMRWAARYAGARYRDFCTIPETKCDAMIKCARDFNIDWVTVMSDPWAEASAFGIEIDYPEDGLPLDTGGHFPDAKSVASLQPCNLLENERCSNRLIELEYYRKNVGNNLFIVGWIEGPVAEYVDLRRATEASLDFLTDPENVARAMDLIVESAVEFINLQVKAGADCIGIGDAFCSQIGPELYMQFAFERQKFLVKKVHEKGAIAKLHICGNTSSILPKMIETGADIIDVDHLVPTMKDYARLLSPGQVFSGKSDPVTIIQNGQSSLIEQSVERDFIEAGKRCIVSAGCEITPGTLPSGMKAFSKAADALHSIM
jgi:uroporphyrinogen decarboxylase